MPNDPIAHVTFLEFLLGHSLGLSMSAAIALGGLAAFAKLASL